MNRPRLTLANVAATTALVLAVSGGTVYAALELGKNDVRSRNLAPGAVKSSDLGKNAVTSPKIKNRTIRGADIAAGVIRSEIADVTGSASGGAHSIPPDNSPVPVPLTGTTTFTPQAGQVSALAAEAQFEVATTNAMQPCAPNVRLFLDNEPTRAFLSPDQDGPTFPTTLVTLSAYDADGPFGLINPGTPMTVSAQLDGDFNNNCTPESKLNRVEIRIVQIR